MDRHLDGYRVDRLVSAGGDGEVWLAWSAGLVARPVAIKWLSPSADAEAVSAFEAETALLATLDHPHLVRVIEVKAGPLGLALVTPFLAGGSMRQLLDERGTLTPGELVAILVPVADALRSLHRRSLVHGDVKPDNVMLTVEGQPMLVDVGVARALGRPDPHLGVAGTAAYLDPAVVAGSGPDERSDVFALAVTAYEALTGRHPHRGGAAQAVAAAAVGSRRALTSWRAIPTAVADIIEGALDPDPDRRPSNPVAFVSALVAVIDADEVSLPGPMSGALAPVDPRSAAAGSTMRFGPSPTASDAGTEARPRWPWIPRLVVALIAVLPLLAMAGVVTASRGGPTATETACSRVAAPPGSGLLRSIDLDGDGCTERVRWTPPLLQVADSSGTARYRIGTGGDDVLFGDWDGDGTASPALYRPSAGEVVYVDRLPEAAGAVVRVGRRVRVPAHGSARVVDRSDGPGQLVEVHGPNQP